MSEDWSKLREVDLLADGRARLDFEIPLAELPRLRAHLARAEGSVAGHVSFERERGLPVADVAMACRAQLVCQRCLEPLELPIESAGRVALVADAAEADRAPAELETIHAPGHRIALRDLVEEELLLALPIVPRHTEECGPASGTDAQSESTAAQPGGRPEASGALAAPDEKHRPFERLNELFNRAQ
ncbi:MAG TPA: YceD family protein [Steroidobacteraceae bacterium]|nr:YceD family protein [Steroidobacteraceae bacterium]